MSCQTAARGGLQAANAAAPARPAALAALPAPRPAQRPQQQQRQCRPARAAVAAAAAAAGAPGVRLAGCGSSVPERFLTNDDLAQLVDTNDEWITTRTGIKKRHILAEGETLGGHAAAAARRALDMAGVDAADVDLIVLATSSPDDVFGSATTVQVRAGARRGRVLAGGRCGTAMLAGGRRPRWPGQRAGSGLPRAAAAVTGSGRQARPWCRRALLRNGRQHRPPAATHMLTATTRAPAARRRRSAPARPRPLT